MVTKKAMLAKLRETDFPKNTGRTNILKGKQTYSHSMVLGKVKVMFKPKGTFAPSRHNKKHAELLKMAKAFLKTHDPKYGFHAVTINKNHAAAKHVDSNNRGHSYIIGLGDYTGGELVFTDKASPNYGTHNIKNRWLRFDGSTEHYVKPFKGERYTLVYYHWS
jgi:hypothetical protein